MPHKIKNWSEFQHYKTGRAAPPWIKLYRDLLNDREWFELPADAAKFLISCWLVAAESNGSLPDSKTLAFRLRLSVKEVEKYLSLCSHWIIKDDSVMLANCLQDAIAEEEEETEEEKIYIHQPKQVRSKDKDSFDKFWIGYPRKVGKGAAEKAWSKALKETDATKILSALASYKFSEDSQFIPHPATWLNQKRFEDATETDTTEIKGAFITGKAAPNYRAWREHFENHGMKFRLASLDRAMDERKPFPVPSDFPLSG